MLDTVQGTGDKALRVRGVTLSCRFTESTI